MSHPPSPNLKTNLSIKLYPTLCFFEGSVLSIGRGTDFPFQVIGYPSIKTDFIDKLISEKDNCYNFQNYYFTPISRKESRYPKFQNQKCFGVKFNSLISDCERSSIEPDLSNKHLIPISIGLTSLVLLQSILLHKLDIKNLNNEESVAFSIFL